GGDLLPGLDALHLTSIWFCPLESRSKQQEASEMTAEQLKALTLEGFERMFNEGDLDYVEQATAPGAVDHQEPEGTDYVAHLKEVIATLRTAFPDLHCARHATLADAEIVRCRSTITGT